jgi:hypothetical protein
MHSLALSGNIPGPGNVCWNKTSALTSATCPGSYSLQPRARVYREVTGSASRAWARDTNSLGDETGPFRSAQFSATAQPGSTGSCERASVYEGRGEGGVLQTVLWRAEGI